MAFWCRMSTMNAMDGFIATMYVKFWSGATPRYTRPAGTVRWSSGMIHWYDVSFDTKFSDRNTPHGSDISFIMRQKVASSRWSGIFCALASLLGEATATATRSVQTMRRTVFMASNPVWSGTASTYDRVGGAGQVCMHTGLLGSVLVGRFVKRPRANSSDTGATRKSA